MGKWELNKKKKKDALYNTAFELFTTKGLAKTTISDIVEKAGVAKGTFYLYFKDKYEIQDILIAKKSEKLFNDALKELRKNYIESFSDQIIFIVNHIIDELKKQPTLLKFISKNLSWGIYNKSILKIYENGENKEDGVYYLFMKGVEENKLPLKNPEVTLFMIMELVSSTCFTSILEKQPLPIEEYKPYLYDAIRQFLKS